MKKYAAFLSFANPDRKLVSHLANLFKSINLEVYFAPENLPKRGSEKWRSEILSAIKNSACIIPVITPHSVNRPWVLYEIGAADVCNLPIYKAKTASISSSQLQKMPGTDTFAYNLGDELNLTNLILKVIEQFKGPEHRETAKKLIGTAILSNQDAATIHLLSVQRKVFIGGSVPFDRKILNNLSIPNMELKGDELLTKIVQDITIELLNNNFLISSCPDVSVVGRTVLETSMKWCERKGKELMQVYSVQGQLTFPEGQSEEALLKALQHGFVSSRKEYLKDHEFLLIVGGNNRTELECRAARELGTVKILPISCIGGTALKISKDDSYDSILHFRNNDGWCETSLSQLTHAMTVQ